MHGGLILWASQLPLILGVYFIVPSLGGGHCARAWGGAACIFVAPAAAVCSVNGSAGGREPCFLHRLVLNVAGTCCMYF